MRLAHVRAFPLVALPLAAGAAAPVLAGGGRVLPLAATAALLLVMAFVAWPWAVLPAAIVGATAASAAVGVSSVTPFVVAHAGVLGAGVLALGIRRVIGAGDVRRRTPADLPMALLAALVGLGCAYGVASGHGTHAALVASYEVGVIPAYYWVATTTLAEEEARRRAMVLFLVGAVALAAIGLAAPGRHGGLLSALALVPTLVGAGRATRRSVRWALLGSAALLGVDVVLAAYRAIWLAGGVAILLVAWRAPRSVRRMLLAVLGLATLLAIGSFALSSGGSSRLAVLMTEVHSSAGYRVPEAVVGLHAFAGAPLLGAGMGQVTPGVWIPGFRLDDVGPVYHVFYVTVLANGGLLLALALLLSMAPALMALRRRGGQHALQWAALLTGFLLAAAFSAPTDGHWELGLLPALALLEMPARSRRRRPGRRAPSECRRARRPAWRPEGATQPARALRPGIHGVIVTHQSREQIEACLDALVPWVDRVVVVDNDSSDGTAELIRQRFPSVHVIANRRNIGFAAAVNQGLAGLDHDTVLLVNPDCVVDADAPRLLRNHLCAHPDVGVAAPRILSGDGRPTVSVHRFETLASVIASRFGGSLIPVPLRRLLAVGRRRRAYWACAPGDEPAAVDWASGACLAVRGDLIKQVGGLDEAYFMYYEDEELCLAALRSGSRVIYLPSATVRHAGGASSSDPAAIWPSLYASMLVFFDRHRPGRVHALRAVLLLRAGIGMVLAGLRGRRRSLLAWWRVGIVAWRGPLPAYGRRP